MFDRILSRKLIGVQKRKVRHFFLEGYSEDELAIMYRVSRVVINKAIKGLKSPERV